MWKKWERRNEKGNDRRERESLAPMVLDVGGAYDRR